MPRASWKRKQLDRDSLWTLHYAGTEGCDAGYHQELREVDLADNADRTKRRLR